MIDERALTHSPNSSSPTEFQLFYSDHSVTRCHSNPHPKPTFIIQRPHRSSGDCTAGILVTENDCFEPISGPAPFPTSEVIPLYQSHSSASSPLQPRIPPQSPTVASAGGISPKVLGKARRSIDGGRFHTELHRGAESPTRPLQAGALSDS
jgi:hypothetical protein